MKGQRVLLLVLGAMLLASQLRAGILFGKKPKPKIDPAQRVPELLGIVRTSPDESKRSEAADELRKYDTQQFPEMIPTLLEVLQTDAKPSVRLSAMSTLVKYRPVSQEIGQAVEQVLAKDASMRVRLQARSTLLQYHWSGYHSPKKDDGKTATKEPPLPRPLPSPQLPPPQPLPPITTAPAPVPAPVPVPVPVPVRVQPASPAPLPTSPQRMPIGPIQPSSYSPPPSAVKADGPDLGSPF